MKVAALGLRAVSNVERYCLEYIMEGRCRLSNGALAKREDVELGGELRLEPGFAIGSLVELWVVQTH